MKKLPVSILPELTTEKDRAVLDSVTMRQALKLAYSVLTQEQKDIVISNDNGARVYLSEFINAALENQP